MKLTDIVIGIAIIALVTLTINLFIDDISGSRGFNVGYNNTNVQYFNKTGELNSEISDKYDRMRNLSTEKGTAVQIITLVPDVLSIMKTFVTFPFVLMGDLLTGIFTIFNLPDYVQNFIIFITTMALIIGFFALVLGRNDV